MPRSLELLPRLPSSDDVHRTWVEQEYLVEFARHQETKSQNRTLWAALFLMIGISFALSAWALVKVM